MVLSKNSKTIEKAIGLPSDMDAEHKYIYCTGFYNIKDYWWMDISGNYVRYTNAPVDHPDYNKHLGEPLVHPEQPLPTTNPEYYTEDGFKRHQAVSPTLIPQRNPAYDPKNPKELWFEVVHSADLVRYIYLDADARENLDIWVQYQLRLADASLLQYRRFAFDLFKGDHPKDRITGAILMLMDQGLFLPEQLVDLTVADMEFIDRTVKLGDKKIACDDNLLDFFTSLTQDRMPEDPLFVLQTVHGRNSVGYNYIYSVLNSLKMDPFYLFSWHANHIFSRVLHRMAIDGMPVEEASVKVYEELANTLGTKEDVRFLIDTKVKNVLLENYESQPEDAEDQPSEPTDDVEKALGFAIQDSFGVPSVFTDLVERRGDELEFSIWLHSEPMHDISPAEQDEIEETMAAISEQQEDEAAGAGSEEATDTEGGKDTAENAAEGSQGQAASPSPGDQPQGGQ